MNASLRTLRTLRTFSALCLTSVALCSTSAWAITVDEADEAFRGVEHTAGVATIQSWGTDAVTVLTQLASDPQRAGFVRARATAALRHCAQSEAIKSTLMRLASTAQQHVLVQRAALTLLADTYNELDFVAGFLAQNEFLVREGAVWALARSARPQARVLLVRAMSGSRDATLRSTFELALRELDRLILAQSVAAQTGSSSSTSSVPSMPSAVVRPVGSSGRAR